MNIKEFELLKKEVTEKVNSDWNTMEALFSNGVIDLGVYNEKEVEYLLKWNKIEIDILDLDTLQDALDGINQFKEQYEEDLKTKIGTTQCDTETDFYDYGGEVKFTYEYYSIPINKEDVIERAIKSRVKRLVQIKLKPNTAIYEKQIDCNLMELFKTEAIDWNTLQKLVYSDCEL